jgi:RNA polymerase sigma factor (sigma-70 family)
LQRLFHHGTSSQSTQRQTTARPYLTNEQQLALVAQVKERNELLKIKQDNFAFEEQWIRINGERAFNTLIHEYRNLIWWIVRRYNFSRQITLDEMFQIAVIAVKYAINKHNPNRKGKICPFSGWACLKIKSRLISLYRSELGLTKRMRTIQNDLVKKGFSINETTPLKISTESDLRSQFGEHPTLEES